MVYEKAEDGLHAVMFSVRRVKVYAETEEGRDPVVVPGKRALVNADTRRVLSVVSDRYRLLENREALELSRKCCIAAFPNTAPARWKVFSVEAPRTGGHCRIDLHHEGQIAGYDWSFSEDAQEAYRPFIRVSNSYNRLCAFSVRFGLIRWACRNGMVDWESSIAVKVTHDKNIEHELMSRIDEAKFRKVLDNLRSVLAVLKDMCVPESRFRKIMLSALKIRKPEGMPADRELAWEELMARLDGIASAYIETHGETGSALVNTLTDLATRPPDGAGGYNFIRRERHALQRLVGVWMRDFGRIAANPSAFSAYLEEPSEESLTALRSKVL